jgi:hypothetical protein
MRQHLDEAHRRWQSEAHGFLDEECPARGRKGPDCVMWHLEEGGSSWESGTHSKSDGHHEKVTGVTMYRRTCTH